MSGHPPRRRLHLHVGLPKTGTTFLQGCLPCNRGWFAERGFDLAPLSDAKGAHHALAWRLRDEGAEAAAAVLRGAAREAAPGRALIASSEVFAGVMTDAERARAFAAALAPDFETWIHITLRRQDQLRESAYAEVARLGARLGPPDPAPAPDGPPMDGLYRNPALERRLEIFADAFGEAALRVTVYHDARRRDPLATFCGQLGLEPPETPVLPERFRNDSMPRRKTLVIAPFKKDDRRHARMVMEAVQASARIETDAIKPLLSPAARRGIVEASREENRRILERWGPMVDGEWLLEAPADEPDWVPAAPPRASDYLSLWLDLMRASLGGGNRRRWPGRLRDAAALTVLTIGAARKARRDRREG